MKTTNIISAYQSILAIENANVDKTKIDKMLDLDFHEARTLAQLCDALIRNGLTYDASDGYYVSYSIKQISKEFDLLRFSDDLVIDIELKSELESDVSKNMKKISIQMEQNHYYLKSINRSVLIYTYVENDGLYKYDAINKVAIRIELLDLITNLSAQSVNYDINPDNLFIPSNYLISPFNSTERFMQDCYFLNDAQQKIKKEIMESIAKHKREVFCISANAGTGKTLLMYDISKTIQCEGKCPVVIHCGKLNTGHNKLIEDYKWNIVPISHINGTYIDKYIPQTTDIVFIDESQRIRDHQLEYIIKRVNDLKIPIVFSYDKKQYLRGGETKDIYEYLKQNHTKITAIKKTLTNKIRINEEIASFITNLFNIGKSNSYLNYENITIEYFCGFENAKHYMTYLCKKREWKAITYTDSTQKIESISQVANICQMNAHDVIGQEFDKVVFVMDKNFRYGENGKLHANSTFYSISGMLYQIVTRVVNELKIIVLDNPELYGKLLEIKALDKQNNN